MKAETEDDFVPETAEECMEEFNDLSHDLIDVIDRLGIYHGNNDYQNILVLLLEATKP